jgi:curved DNA-binding protein CbpA
MNADEAKRCIEIGKNSIIKGDKEKAIRMLEKSLKLHPSPEAEYLLDQARKMTASSVKVEQSRGPEPSQASPTQTFTPEQEKMCRDILQKSNYYEILGVSQSASQAEIKKAYRSLALKLHPDKNQSPSASEAFKKINKSFACLSDETKRRTYDQTGQETIPGIEMNRNFNDSDFAEQVFRDFFGESFFFPQAGFHRVYRTGNHQRRSRQEPQENGRLPFMQFLPVIILLIFSFGSSLFSTPEPYSFHLTPTYSLKRSTENYGVEYFMEPSFAKSLTNGEKIKLEKNVERDYLNYLMQMCENQKRKKNQMMQKANYHKGNTGKQYRDYAESIDLSSCDTYREITGK